MHHLGRLPIDVRDAERRRRAEAGVCLNGSIVILQIGAQGRGQIPVREIPLANDKHKRVDDRQDGWRRTGSRAARIGHHHLVLASICRPYERDTERRSGAARKVRSITPPLIGEHAIPNSDDGEADAVTHCRRLAGRRCTDARRIRRCLADVYDVQLD